jgi:hypothetical protein
MEWEFFGLCNYTCRGIFRIVICWVAVCVFLSGGFAGCAVVLLEVVNMGCELTCIHDPCGAYRFLGTTSIPSQPSLQPPDTTFSNSKRRLDSPDLIAYNTTAS